MSWRPATATGVRVVRPKFRPTAYGDAGSLGAGRDEITTGLDVPGRHRVFGGRAYVVGYLDGILPNTQ